MAQSPAPSTTPFDSSFQTDLDDENEAFGVVFDSTRIDWAEESYFDDDSDLDDTDACNDALDDKDFCSKLVMMAEKQDGDNAEWIPANLKRSARIKIGE